MGMAPRGRTPERRIDSDIFSNNSIQILYFTYVNYRGLTQTEGTSRSEIP
jgi:hypothetical protein